MVINVFCPDFFKETKVLKIHDDVTTNEIDYAVSFYLYGLLEGLNIKFDPEFVYGCTEWVAIENE